MGVTNTFKEAVNSGNVRGVRIMMKDSLLIDPSFNQFNQMEEVASHKIQGLYEEHDGCGFQDKSTWDDDYMNTLMVQVVYNFSKQRVNHLKEVVHYLRPVSKESSYQQQEYQDQQEGNCQIEKPGSLLNSRQNSHKTKESYHQTKSRDQQEGNCRIEKPGSLLNSHQNSHKTKETYHQTECRDQQEGNCLDSKIKKASIGGATIGGATSGGIGAALARYTLEAGGTAASSVAGGAAVGAVIGGVVVLCIVLGIANHYNKNKED